MSRKRGRGGEFWGIVGGTVGSLCWVVIVCFQVHSAMTLTAAATAIAAGGVGIFFGAQLLDHYPKRRLSIAGISLLWLVVVNFVVLNLIYAEIPRDFWGVSTGVGDSVRKQLNLLMGGLSLLGFWFLLRDIRDG